MKLLRCPFLVLFLVAAILVAPARSAVHAQETERRMALVMGIGAYLNVPELPNPVNDAQAIAKALAELGFDVDVQLDLDRWQMSTALRDFGIRAAEADVALIFYAGHGIQVAGQNYLIPADARLERERDLVYEALPLNLLLGELAQARQLGILILDACRNNPFVERLSQSVGVARRSEIGAGLTRIDDTPSDTLVAMATRADQLAEDGTGVHSPYTQALLTHLQEPGLELGLFFRRVRDSVLQETQGRQEPYIFGSLGASPFYFNPMPPNRNPEVAAIEPVTVPDDAEAAPLGIAPPTDPDQDRLFAQVDGLPRGGSVQVGDRIVLIGDYLTIEQLAATTFKPDRSATGAVGAFEFSVMDGQGGITRDAVAIAVEPSNQPPQVAARRRLLVVANPLGIGPPIDPDDDPLTVTVTAVPEKGRIRGGGEVVGVGDRLPLSVLTGLTFDPEQSAPGSAGHFSFTVEDDRGGRASSTIEIEVAAPGTGGSDIDPAERVWSTIAGEDDAVRLEAFLALFPDSAFADAARAALEALAGQQEDASSDVPVAEASPTEPEPEPEPESEATGAAREPVESTFTVVVDSNLRSGPSARSDRVGRLAKGSNVTVLERVSDANWYHITTEGGVDGFIFGELIAPLAATAPETGPEERPDEIEVEVEVAATAEPPSPATRAHGNGNTFKDCPECPVMARIPAGSFTMGNDSGPAAERPAHRVAIERPFALGVYEVTVAEWQACVDGGGCDGTLRMMGATPSTPVHNLHWDDALAYTAWLSRKTGQRYRLPSEAEWEYAARAGTGTPFWWGAQAGIANANCLDCGGMHERLTPLAAGSFQPNPFGLHDMNGSVAEWTADCWTPDHRGAGGDAAARLDGDCRKRVLRGGSWRNEKIYVTATSRLMYDHNVRYLAHGFRVARDLN